MGNNNCAGAEGGLKHKHSAEVMTQLREELDPAAQCEPRPAISATGGSEEAGGAGDDDGPVLERLVEELQHGRRQPRPAR